jgi:putative flippase GtrA
VHRSVVRFVIVGCANFVVSFAAFYASYHYLPLAASSGRGAVANVVAYGAGMLNSFLLNRLWTFRAEGRVAVHALKFVLLNAATLAVSTMLVQVLVDWVGYAPHAEWQPNTIANLTAHNLGMKQWAIAQQR